MSTTKTLPEVRKIRSLIDDMDEWAEVKKQASENYDEVRAMVLEELVVSHSDHFNEVHEGVRRKADVIRASSQMVQDTILGDLTHVVQGKVTKMVIDPDALMQAIMNGEISPTVINKITNQVIDSNKLNAAIERNEIPLAIVQKHTVIKESKPYAKITRKTS